MVLSLVAINLVQEFVSRIRANYYGQQGFEVLNCFGVSGLAGLIMKSRKKNNHLEDMYLKVLELRRKGMPGIAFSDSRDGCASVLLADTNLVREYATKENDVIIRDTPGDVKINVGFILKGGEEGLSQRAIFSEFFRIDNLAKLIPIVNKVIKQQFDSVDVKDGYLNIPKSKVFVEQLIIQLVNNLIFGEGAEIVRSDKGVPFCEELVHILNIIYSSKSVFHPLNYLTKDLYNKWNISPWSRQASQRAESMRKKMEEYIAKRKELLEKSAEERNKFCLINMMLLYNASAEESKRLTMEEMVGNCNMFLIGGFDTTTTAVCSLFYCLAKHPEVLKQLREQTKQLDRPDITFEALDGCEILERVIKESLRVNPPAGLLFIRKIIKDFNLGKYKLRKGDKLFVPIGPIMWDIDQFPSERNFDLDAITEKNKKNYMPFHLGKRNCVGQQLAQLEMKLIATYVANHYDLEALHEQSKYLFSFTMQMTKCDVKFKVRD